MTLTPNATCQRCGREFHVPPYALARGRKYCDNQCRFPVVPKRVCAYCGRIVERKRDERFGKSYCDSECFAKAYSKGDERKTCYFSKRKGLWIGRCVLNGKWRSVSGPTREQVWGRMLLISSGVPLGRGAKRQITPDQIRYALEFLEPLDHIDRYDRQTQGVAMLKEYIRYAEAGLAPVSTPAEPVQPPPQRRRAAWLDALPKRVEDAS